MKNLDESVGFFVKGTRVKNGLSFTKIFNTNINNLSDFINGSDDYAD